MCRLGAQFVAELLERTVLPPFPPAAALVDNVLMRYHYLAPEIIHPQQVRNGVIFVRADVVHGIAKADVFERRVPQGPFGPGCTVVERILEPQFGIALLRDIFRFPALAPGLLDGFQFEAFGLAHVEPVDNLQHPTEVRTVIPVVRHGQHGGLVVAVVF